MDACGLVPMLEAIRELDSRGSLREPTHLKRCQ